MSSIAKTSIKIGGDAQELEAVVAKAGASLKGMVTSAVALLGTALSVKWGVDLLKESQSAQISLESLTGSAELAKSTLAGIKGAVGDEWKTFSKSLRELSLAGYALEDIPGILRIVGDAASAVSPDNLQGGMDSIVSQLVMIKETGEVTERQLKSLGASGVNAFEILRKAGGFETVADLKDKLAKDEVDAGTALRQLLEGMDEKFKGSFEKRQSEHIGELIEDFGYQASEGMLAFMKGATGGDCKRQRKSAARGHQRVLI